MVRWLPLNLIQTQLRPLLYTVQKLYIMLAFLVIFPHSQHTRMHAHTHTHARTHARTHAHMHARTYTHRHTHTCMDAHRHTHTNATLLPVMFMPSSPLQCLSLTEFRWSCRSGSHAMLCSDSTSLATATCGRTQTTYHVTRHIRRTSRLHASWRAETASPRHWQSTVYLLT